MHGVGKEDFKDWVKKDYTYNELVEAKFLNLL